jgi:hypothetical protein
MFSSAIFSSPSIALSKSDSSSVGNSINSTYTALYFLQFTTTISKLPYHTHYIMIYAHIAVWSTRDSKKFKFQRTPVHGIPGYRARGKDWVWIVEKSYCSKGVRRELFTWMRWLISEAHYIPWLNTSRCTNSETSVCRWKNLKASCQGVSHVICPDSDAPFSLNKKSSLPTTTFSPCVCFRNRSLRPSSMSHLDTSWSRFSVFIVLICRIRKHDVSRV